MNRVNHIWIKDRWHPVIWRASPSEMMGGQHDCWPNRKPERLKLSFVEGEYGWEITM
jgi:hypothetical protein